MKKFPIILLALLALAFTSCLEEEAITERNLELPENPLDLNRVDASNLVGEKFGMARITLVNENLVNEFSMEACELSVLAAGSVNEPAPSLLEEAGSSLSFVNTIQADALDPTQNTITFSRLSGNTSSGDFAFFLESSVLPIVADAPLKVSREGDNMIIECFNCPFQYEGRTYTDRQVILSLVD